MKQARDELRDLIQSQLHDIDGFERWNLQAPEDLADALLAAGYQKPSPNGIDDIANLCVHGYAICSPCDHVPFSWQVQP